MLVKLEWLGYRMVKNYNDMLSRLYLIPERYGRTDGQICYINIARQCSLRAIKTDPTSTSGNDTDDRAIVTWNANRNTYATYRTALFPLLTLNDRHNHRDSDRERLSASVHLFVRLSVYLSPKCKKTRFSQKLSNGLYWCDIGSSTWAFHRTHYWIPKIQDGWDPPSWKST